MSSTSAKGSKVVRAVGIAALALFGLQYLSNRQEANESDAKFKKHMDDYQSEEDSRRKASRTNIDEQWVISPGKWNSSTFELSTTMSVHVEMSPVQDADKGVLLRLVPAEYFGGCIANGQCRVVGGFDGVAVRYFDHSASLPAGRFTLYVQNTENIINSAIVRVHVSVSDNQ